MNETEHERGRQAQDRGRGAAGNAFVGHRSHFRNQGDPGGPRCSLPVPGEAARLSKAPLATAAFPKARVLFRQGFWERWEGSHHTTEVNTHPGWVSLCLPLGVPCPHRRPPRPSLTHTDFPQSLLSPTAKCIPKGPLSRHHSAGVLRSPVLTQCPQAPRVRVRSDPGPGASGPQAMSAPGPATARVHRSGRASGPPPLLPAGRGSDPRVPRGGHQSGLSQDG